MDLYRDLYFYMLRASEKALRELERQNYGTAQEILISAQQAAEERFLNQDNSQAAEPETHP